MNGVWHKDGATAQIRSMIDWLGTPYDRPDDEHIGKVQTNLGAAADALEGAVDALRRIAQSESSEGVAAANALADLGIGDPLLSAAFPRKEHS